MGLVIGYIINPVTNYFQITRFQLLEMIDELFADTVVICHHEKLSNNLFIIN